MGFHEDDRIRSKNKIYEEALKVYEMFKKVGLSDKDILDTVARTEKSIAVTADPYRIDLCIKIKNLVDSRSYEKK